MSALKKAGKAIAGLLSRVFGSKEQEERRHEREMAELEALRAGRVSPQYLARYIAVLLFAGLACLVLVDVTWPDLFPGSPIDAIDHVVRLAADFLRHIFGM